MRRIYRRACPVKIFLEIFDLLNRLLNSRKPPVPVFTEDTGLNSNESMPPDQEEADNEVYPFW